MYGYRKFFLTLAGLVVIALIGMKNPQVDFMGLGICIGLVLTPIAGANAMKYKYQGVSNEKSA